MRFTMKAYKVFQQDFILEQEKQQLDRFVIEEQVVTPNRTRIYARNVEKKQLKWYAEDHRVVI